MLIARTLISSVILFATAQSITAQQWQFNGNNAYYNFNNGNVGIGTTNPGQKLSIQAPAGSNVVDMALRNTDGTSLLTFSTNSAGTSFITSYYGITLNAQNSPAYYAFKIGGTDIMRIQHNVGIGTISPTQKLDVNGNIKTTGFILPTGAAAGKVLTSDASGVATWQSLPVSSSGWELDGNFANAIKSIGTKDPFDLRIITDNTERLRILGGGGVAIGTGTLPANDPDALLAVKGKICALKVKVTQTGWADHVFNADYRLMPLPELEKYIHQHHHLPEVPSAAEVEKNGLDLGANQAILLQKIEELTLYLIEQSKEQKAQDTRLRDLTERLEKLQADNDRLKELIRNKLQ